MGETRNQTDFRLSNQRGIVTNCKVITKADLGSDRRLVRMTWRIDKRLASLKTIKSNNIFFIVIHKNSVMREIFEIYHQKTNKQNNNKTDLKNLPNFEKKHIIICLETLLFLLKLG